MNIFKRLVLRWPAAFLACLNLGGYPDTPQTPKRLETRLSLVSRGQWAVLGADLPGPGDYYLFATEGDRYRVVASGYAFEKCHVSVKVPLDAQFKVFTARFEADGE